MSDKIEIVIEDMARQIRTSLQRMDSLHSMLFRIEIEGHIHEGDLKVSYGLGSSYSPDVTGDSIQEVTEEYLRRKGWNERHAPLSIGYSKPVEVDTDGGSEPVLALVDEPEAIEAFMTQNNELPPEAEVETDPEGEPI